MRQRIIRLGGFTLILGVIGMIIISVAAYELVARASPNCALIPSAQANTPANFTTDDNLLMPDYENVTFPSATQVSDATLTLHGFFIPTQGNPETASATVIIVHGIGACRRDPAMLTVAGMLHSAGFNTLVIDLRNMGDSDSDNGRMGAGGKEYRDVIGAIDYLVDTRGLSPEHIGVMGFSMGAATALITAGEDARVGAVWADSAFADMDIVMDHLLSQVRLNILKTPILLAARLLYGETPTETDPVDYAPALTRTPVFLVHSDRDRAVIFENFTVLSSAFDLHNVPYDAWITQSEHVDTINDQRDLYTQRLTTFFRDALE